MRLGEMPPDIEGEVVLCDSSVEEMGILLCGRLSGEAHTIHCHIGEAGFGMTRHPLTGGSWDELLDKYEIDVLVTPDVEFARRVIRRNPLIDTLVYGIDVELYTAPGNPLYARIWTHPDACYSEPAIHMIDSCRRKWSDMVYLRGMVISQVVDIEAHINDALAAHFGLMPSTKLGEQFEEYILENPQYSMEGKKQALGKILKATDRAHMWEGMSGMISDLQKKRNKLAHCKVDLGNAVVITSMGKEYRYGRREMRDMLKHIRMVRQRLLDIADDIPVGF